MLDISYREHKANDYERQQVSILIGRQKLLLSSVKRRKLQWFGHVFRHDMLPKIMLRVIVNAIGAAAEDRINHPGTTTRNGQASRCRHCCALRMTEVDGQ